MSAIARKTFGTMFYGYSDSGFENAFV